MNGIIKVYFGFFNDFNDMIDDIIYIMLECEDEFFNGNKCDMFIYVNFFGFINGMVKCRDN